MGSRMSKNANKKTRNGEILQTYFPQYIFNYKWSEDVIIDLNVITVCAIDTAHPTGATEVAIGK